MLDAAHGSGKRSPRERRREVERLLAERALVDGPRRLGPLQTEDTGFGVRLRGVLLELGPFGVLLGRYLSTRLDVLSIREASQLGAIEAGVPALPAAAVREIVAAELGPPDEIFAAIDDEACSSRVLYQVHRAELRNGLRVLLKVVRPGMVEGVDRELAVLAVLNRVFARRDGAPFDEVLDAFRRDLRERLDLGREAEALEILARDAGARELLAVAHVEASTSRVLVVEDPDGRTLEELAVAPGPLQVDAEDLARRFCLAWLRAAVTAGTFPVEVEAQELPDGRLAWTGGHFASLPAPSQVNLWDYLRATARYEPDQAAACLHRELVADERAASAGELRSRLRQVVPFRDGAWTEDSENVTEFAVLHWRLTRRYGFRPRPHLVSFYRGLYSTARAVEPFAYGSDPMGDALTDLEWLAGWNQARQLTSPGQLAKTFETYFAGLVELPRKLDRLLRMADEGGFVVKTQPASRTRRGKAPAAAALVLAMVAAALVGQRFAAAGGVWAERLTTAVFALFALLFLRVVATTR